MTAVPVAAGSDDDRTEGGRWIVVNGRRWRATDPSIPDPFRQELVNALMAARRSVGAARRNQDEAAEKAARAHVQRAKVALGERGEPWWDPPSEAGLEQRIRATACALAFHRAPDRTICPSDVARAIGGSGWRSLMSGVRSAVRDLASAGVVEVTQRGVVLDPSGPWRGPIRVRHRGFGAS